MPSVTKKDEEDFFRLKADGLSNERIATELGFSIPTVSDHLNNPKYYKGEGDNVKPKVEPLPQDQIASPAGKGDRKKTEQELLRQILDDMGIMYQKETITETFLAGDIDSPKYLNSVLKLGNVNTKKRKLIITRYFGINADDIEGLDFGKDKKDEEKEEKPLSQIDRVPKLRGQLKALQKKISRLPLEYKENLIAEKEQIMAFIKELLKKEIDETLLNEIETAYEYELQQTIDEAVEEAKESKSSEKKESVSSEGGKSIMEDAIKEAEEEAKLAKFKRMQIDDELERKRLVMLHEKQILSMSGQDNPGGLPAGMVPVKEPIIDPQTGEVKKDPDTNMPLMRDTYRSANQPTMSPFESMYVDDLRKKKDGGEENTTLAIILEMIKQGGKGDKGGDMKDILLEMQKQRNDDQKFQLELYRDTMEKLNAGGSKESEWMMKLTEMQNTHNQQTMQMQQGMNDLNQQRLTEERDYFRSRDPINEGIDNIRKYEALGWIRGDKSADDKVLEQNTRVLEKLTDKVDAVSGDLKETSKPIMEALAANLRQGGGTLPQVTQRTEAQRQALYRRAVDRVDGVGPEEETHSERLAQLDRKHNK